MNNQTIVISDRNAVSINNVKNVNSFNENEFLVDTPFGTLKVNGKNLNIGKMDTDKQELLIKGNIDCFYSFLYRNISRELWRFALCFPTYCSLHSKKPKEW